MKRGRKLPVFSVILAALLVLIAGVVSWRNSVTSSNKDRLRAIAARGEPTSLDELEKFYKAVPDSSNAALLWLAGAAALTNDLGNIASKLTIKRGVSLDENEWRETAEAVAANRQAIGLFHRASSMDQSHYPLEFTQQTVGGLQHLPELKRVAQVLRAQTVVALSQSDTAGAAAAMNGIFAVARSITQEPLILSQSVGCGIDAVGVQTLEFALNATAFREPELKAIQAALSKNDDPESAALGLIGERAFFITGLNDPDTLVSMGARRSEMFLLPAARLTGFLQRELRFGIAALTTNIAVARFPDPQRFHSITNSTATINRARNGFYRVAPLFVPGLERYLSRDVNHRALLRTAQAALAVERFRQAHGGRLPDQLSTLVPAYLEKHPVDPFDGQPVRYKSLDRGYVIWCIGADLKDDGGTEKGPQTLKGAPEDVTFIMERGG